MLVLLGISGVQKRCFDECTYRRGSLFVFLPPIALVPVATIAMLKNVYLV